MEGGDGSGKTVEEGVKKARAGRGRGRAPETRGDGVGLVRAVLDVSGDDLGILIGRRGDTLASLQYVVNLIVGRKLKAKTAFGVDVEGYRRRRGQSLKRLDPPM